MEKEQEKEQGQPGQDRRQEDIDPLTIPPWAKSDLEIKGPAGFSARARNLRRMDYAFILGLIAGLYMFWVHMEDTKRLTQEQVKSNTEVAAAIRFFSCLYAVETSKKVDELKDPYSLCNKMGKPQ